MRNAMGVAIPPAGALDCLPRAASQPEPLSTIVPRVLADLGVTIDLHARDERADPQPRRRPA